MATAIEIFQAPTGQTVRTIIRDGEPWFVAADVCAVLGISNSRDAVKRLDEAEKGVGETDTLGGQQSISIVSEAGLYRLVMRSNKPDAVRFQMWIAHEVLPTIRKTGRFEIAQQHAIPQTFAQALELAARQARQLEAANTALAVAEPKADAWDVLASTAGDYSVREAAYILNRDPAIDTGQNRLFATLRDSGLIDKKGIPYASHSRHLRLRAGSFEHPHTHEQVLTQQVRITPDGVRYLHKRLGGTRPVAFDQLLREAI